MAMAGVGNLTPQEAATRAERWFGARVEYATGKIKIYPKDPAQPMVVISDRWTNGNDRRNAVSRLQRSGLDVINGQTPPESVIRTDGRSIDAHLTQKIELPALPTREDTPVTSVESSRNGHPTPAAMANKLPTDKLTATKAPSPADYDALLGMLAQAEGRITELTERLDAAANVIDALSARVSRLDQIEHENRARYAALNKRIKSLSERMDEAAALPLDPAAQAERERAELLDKAVALLESLPPAATMTAGSIAASLEQPEKGNVLGKLLATAAKDGRVQATKMGAQNLYRALPKGAS